MRPDLPQPADRRFPGPSKRFYHDSIDDGAFEVPSAAGAIYQAYRMMMLTFSVALIWLPVIVLWILLILAVILLG